MGAVENKVAIVTGGAGGIGSAIVRRFAREGAKVAIADIDADAGKAQVVELTAKGADVIPILANVTDKISVDGMVKATLDRWGRVDILVNVAGGADRKLVV